MSTPVINVSQAIRGQLSYGQRDYNGDKTTTQFYCIAPGSTVTYTNSTGAYTYKVDADAINAQTQLWYNLVNGSADASAAVRTATGVSIGVNTGEILTVGSKGGVNPSNWSEVMSGQAQAEWKWRIVLNDPIDNRNYTYTIGCANGDICENGYETLPSAAVTRLKAFLAGPQVSATNSALSPTSVSFNLPIIRSWNGHPLYYAGSSIIGIHRKN